MTPLETLARVRDELEQAFVERSEVIEGALVALLSRSHVLLIGPPGAYCHLKHERCESPHPQPPLPPRGEGEEERSGSPSPKEGEGVGG